MQSLKWSVISFTEKGAELAEKIKRLSKEQIGRASCRERV